MYIDYHIPAYFFFLAHSQGSNPHPLQCKHEVLITRPPGKSWESFYSILLIPLSSLPCYSQGTKGGSQTLEPVTVR